MILFKEIYGKAITLFDDPDIQRAYYEDTVEWEKTMRPYLENYAVLFTNPTRVTSQLLDQTPPKGVLETFDGNGSDSYVLSQPAPENADFSFRIDGEIDQLATYDAETHTVTFSKAIPEGTQCSAEWYYCGSFDSDFSAAASTTTSASMIRASVVDILARALVLNWAENEKNFVLEIRNLLTDTDFRMYSPANSVRAKTEWVKQLRFDFDTMTNKLSWNLFSRAQHGGRFYG